ncbi:MAG: hypothetical protein AAB539_00260 [Patescibacteria group bacterium]|mgnify:CR=1 FL=1
MPDQAPQPQQPQQSPDNLTNLIGIALAALILFGFFGTFLGSIFIGYTNFIERFYAGQFSILATIFKIFFILLDALFFAWMVLALKRLRAVRFAALRADMAHYAKKPLTGEDEFGKTWESVAAFLESDNPAEWNMALLRADALLEEALTQKGYEGATLADKLRIVDPHQLPSIESVWSAHRLRNMIAHDLKAEYARDTIRTAIDAYQNALQELGFLAAQKENDLPR